MDPDAAIFVIDLQDASKKLIFEHNFLWLLLFEGTFTLFFKDKNSKRVTNSRIQGFSYYFYMMIEGSGSRVGSGSIPLTSGSGSGRPKNTWIRWIRIRNTGLVSGFHHLKFVMLFGHFNLLSVQMLNDVYHEKVYLKFSVKFS
jgi:hypothetical protein